MIPIFLTILTCKKSTCSDSVSWMILATIVSQKSSKVELICEYSWRMKKLSCKISAMEKLNLAPPLNSYGQIDILRTGELLKSK